ncbi:MAG TPA: DUF72 domain-containing protein [Dokdonella sp.]|uniref:DUF72 domain-containing protein n=1 Tax=Dokdonella sp. TaxID=2291710 RepID=UPI002BB3B8F4|nr:DUF72 domain-containing protein [Dokdonella sp.]HUD41037.1 DUF72 domain-containing protein [Dokdonella sp.]
MVSTAPARRPALRIGCAGWSIPAAQTQRFPAAGTHLTRYAEVFDAVEINSSFYRPHRPQTYRRWAGSVPAGFHFSVKMPRSISHEHRLRAPAEDALAPFLEAVAELGDRLGALLLQLPPSLRFDAAVVGRFLHALRARHAGPVACEPRHASWFEAAATALLREHHIARVAADPARVPRAALPAADRRIEYLRLHGAPRIYYDAYSPAALDALAARLARASTRTRTRWCIFDNTALGHASADALALIERLREREQA